MGSVEGRMPNSKDKGFTFTTKGGVIIFMMYKLYYFFKSLLPFFVELWSAPPRMDIKVDEPSNSTLLRDSGSQVLVEPVISFSDSGSFFF